MKAIIPKSALLEHRKTLRLARLPKSIAKKAEVEITVSERLVIVGPGFAEKLDCEVLEWGNAFMPYTLWQRVIQVAETVREDTVEFSVQEADLTIGTMRIANPAIRVRRLERLGLELPVNAGPVDFLRLFFRYAPERLESAGLWSLVLWAAKELRVSVDTAWKPLATYEIGLKDLVETVGRKLGMKEEDKKGFFNLLYPKNDWYPPGT